MTDPTTLARRVLDVAWRALREPGRHNESLAAHAPELAHALLRYEQALAHARRHLDPGAVAEIERILAPR